MNARAKSLFVILFGILAIIALFYSIHKGKLLRAAIANAAVVEIQYLQVVDHIGSIERKEIPQPPAVAVVILKPNGKEKQPVEHTPVHIESDVYKIVRNDFTCLALNIYHEARNDGEDSMLAVGELTLQRVASPRYPDTVCSVVKDPAQFSWYWDGKRDFPRRQEHKHYKYAETLAQRVIDGEVDLLDDRVLNYHADYIQPAWANKMTLYAQIGTHKYYIP